MSFREKSAWIQFLTLAIIAGGYYLAIYLDWIPSSGAEHFRILSRCIGAFIVIQIVLHIIAALQNLDDARSPRDERETAISHRSHTYGYYVLILCVFGLFHIGHAHVGVSALLHWAFFSVIAANLTITLTQIILFRRNA